MVTNALRLNFVKLYKKEENTDTTTLQIKGMMCGHCEATVQKILESFDGVTCISVSHKSGTATVKSEKDIDRKEIANALKKEGYQLK